MEVRVQHWIIGQLLLQDFLQGLLVVEQRTDQNGVELSLKHQTLFVGLQVHEVAQEVGFGVDFPIAHKSLLHVLDLLESELLSNVEEVDAFLDVEDEIVSEDLHQLYLTTDLQIHLLHYLSIHFIDED